MFSGMENYFGSLGGILENGETALSKNQGSPGKKIKKVASTTARASATGIYI